MPEMLLWARAFYWEFVTLRDGTEQTVLDRELINKLVDGLAPEELLDSKTRAEIRDEVDARIEKREIPEWRRKDERAAATKARLQLLRCSL